jgi:hypothetical protein
MSTEGFIGTFVAMLVVIIVLFLLMREVACWYFKINKMVELLTRQLNNLQEINKALNPGMKEKIENQKTTNQ